MLFSNLKVLELNKKYNLIEGLCERELNNPEGFLLELRVGEVYTLKENDRGFLGIDKKDEKNRSTPLSIKIADIKEDGNKIITMKSGDYFLVTTMEKINCPAEKIEIGDGYEPMYLIPSISPRSTLQRCGVALHCTDTNPGYSGTLTFGLSNKGNNEFDFQLGARMFAIKWIPVIGEIARAYEGQWQYGRVSTGGKLERQV